jgi:Ca2+-binding EF-hand superfamily protein
MKIYRAIVIVALACGVASPAALAQGKAKAAAKGRTKAQTHQQQEQNQQARRQSGEQMRFYGLDRNNDGVITRAEWSGNDQSFREHDTNGDGILSGNEVRPGGEAPPRGQDRSLLRFEQADRNGDGRIVRDEWTRNAAAFNRMDRNADGVITRDEFSTAFAERAADTSGADAPRNATRAYQAGHDKGLAEGRQAGREDKNVNGGKWDLEGQRELEQADSGYRADLGDRAEYQSGYRAAFRLGYREGFGPRR